jgi:CheY-like chemotaxis protein
LHTNEPAARQLLATIEKSALHGASLIKQVLLFARGADGEQVVLQIRQLVGDMGRLLRETFPRSIEVRTEVDRDLALVRGDATQLNQVLMNLCVNARDAMPHGGVLSISAKNASPPPEFFRANPAAKEGPCVVISVADNGSGIPRELLERIFDPFFTTKELGKGTGLGLSTALGIVKSHGGVLQVSSEPGRGTRFDIYLAAILTEKPGRTMDTRSPLPRGNGQGILVIDDEGYIRDVIGSTLRYCGYRTFIAAGGQAGLDLYQENCDEIDMALVDMMMPGLDGIATMKRLREMNPQLRLLAMSGMLENELLDNRDGLRGLGFLRKPVTVEGLLGKIAEVLNTPTAAQTAAAGSS